MNLIRFREGPQRKPPRRKLGHLVEVGLAAVALTAFVAWWAIGFAQYCDIHSPPPNAIRIHVVAKQWMWQFAYPNGATAEDDLRVPIGEPVEVVLTSRDVIHSFYVPAFRLKQDAIPGRITSLWFTATEPGTYDILCAEYCGAGHSRMRGRVIALPPAVYAQWTESHVAPDLVDAGAKLSAAYGCLRCHSIDGTGYLAPTWKGLYGARRVLTTGEIVTADDAYLTESMMDPQAKLVVGFQPVMPSYLGLLSGPEAAAIVEYIRSLGGAP